VNPDRQVIPRHVTASGKDGQYYKHAVATYKQRQFYTLWILTVL